MSMQEQTKLFLKGIANSYSQIFFSNKLFFGIVLIIITLMSYTWSGIYAALFGLVGVIASNGFAWWLGFDRHKISQGLYGFNTLLVSLWMGVSFEPGWRLFILVLLTAMFCLFLTIMLEGVIGKYGLPFLSIPFLIAIWILMLATKSFEALEINQMGALEINEISRFGGQTFVDLDLWWKDLAIRENTFIYSIETYFKSLGAIFFQYKLIPGIILSIILLVNSRIAFSLSLIGFYTAYFFYQIVGLDITMTGYSYIGFNYILTAIALGGFFLIPNKSSYLWVVLLIPVVAIITISFSSIFGSVGMTYFQGGDVRVYPLSLPIYSLPFNIVVILFLYVMKLRTRAAAGLFVVSVQQNSPEKNLYSFNNAVQRFQDNAWFALRLPFWGSWTVSQAHKGEITHKGDWQHAWDFVIEDREKKTYKNMGTDPEDFYCYGKTILAPADGYVEEIHDGIPDNKIGEVNLKDNWGNTIVIRHSTLLYTALSHIKEGSFTVTKGEYVKKGQALGLVGNSGRSPEPHLHMQLQSTPFIGSKTLDYPLGYYLEHSSGEYELRSFDRPMKDEVVANITPNSLVKNAFYLIPGRKLSFEVKEGQDTYSLEWEIVADALGSTYVYCKKTESVAYFTYDGEIHYFRHFSGDKNSLLYYFFLAFYKVQPGFYKNLDVSDIFPVNLMFPKWLLFLQDFIAPFHIFLKSRYKLIYQSQDDDMNPTEVVLSSSAVNTVMGRTISNFDFDAVIDETGVSSLSIRTGNKTITAKCINE